MVTTVNIVRAMKGMGVWRMEAGMVECAVERNNAELVTDQCVKEGTYQSNNGNRGCFLLWIREFSRPIRRLLTQA